MDLLNYYKLHLFYDSSISIISNAKITISVLGIQLRVKASQIKQEILDFTKHNTHLVLRNLENYVLKVGGESQKRILRCLNVMKYLL